MERGSADARDWAVWDERCVVCWQDVLARHVPGEEQRGKQEQTWLVYESRGGTTEKYTRTRDAEEGEEDEEEKMEEEAVVAARVTLSPFFK